MDVVEYGFGVGANSGGDQDALVGVGSSAPENKGTSGDLSLDRLEGATESAAGLDLSSGVVSTVGGAVVSPELARLISEKTAVGDDLLGVQGSLQSLTHDADQLRRGFARTQSQHAMFAASVLSNPKLSLSEAAALSQADRNQALSEEEQTRHTQRVDAAAAERTGASNFQDDDFEKFAQAFLVSDAGSKPVLSAELRSVDRRIGSSREYRDTLQSRFREVTQRVAEAQRQNNQPQSGRSGPSR